VRVGVVVIYFSEVHVLVFFRFFVYIFRYKIYKTIDRVTRIPLKTGGELRCSGRVCRSCSTSHIRRVNLVTHPVISHERGKDREVFFLSSIIDTTFT
jgi:hypothetical protein